MKEMFMKAEIYYVIKCVPEYSMPEPVTCVDASEEEMESIVKEMEKELTYCKTHKIRVVKEAYHNEERLPFDEKSMPAGVLQYWGEGCYKRFFISPELLRGYTIFTKIDNQEEFLFWSGKRWIDWDSFFGGVV